MTETRNQGIKVETGLPTYCGGQLIQRGSNRKTAKNKINSREINGL